MDRRAFILGLPLVLSACSAKQVWAPDDAVARAIHREDGPKHLTLLTMKNAGSGNGAHSALVINASQRVLFDPAGSFSQEHMPERNDVLFGFTPQLEQYYISFHARSSYYVISQKVEVPADVAEKALQLALLAGPVAQANCARTTSRILNQLPGFEVIRKTWGPNRIEEDFAKLAGVERHEYYEDDSDDKSIAAAQINAALTQPN